MSKRIASFNCFGLGSSREYVAELVKHYDFLALQETWHFPWDLAVPSALGIDMNTFSLSPIDVTNARATLDKQSCVIMPTFIYHD